VSEENTAGCLAYQGDGSAGSNEESEESPSQSSRL